MTYASTAGHRGATAAVLLVGGGGLAAATWLGGEHGLALGLVAFYAVAAVVAFVWSGRDGDVAAIMRVGGDERQRRLDLDATAYAGLAMAVAAIIGAIVSAARNHGDIGQYGVICVVGGVSYVVSLAVLKSRGSTAS
jgi:hypothetical protein